MKRSEIRTRIEHNLTEAGFTIDDLRLQPDPFRGWHLVIVSSNFANLSNRERRETALKGLEGEIFEWVDLLTPEEREWAGDLPIGIGLIVIGVVALIYQGITYTTREKVLEVGPVEVTAERRKTIPLPPVLGGLALAGGIVLVVVGSRPS
jgi:hypothetical protein